MRPGVRNFALTAHVTCSVGWLGAVTAFFVLAVAGLASQDAERVRAVYLAMDVIGWFVLVPFAVASLVTGLIQSLGTRWGVLRHYWVLFKLLINAFATIVLLLYMRTLETLADVAAQTPPTDPGVDALRSFSPLVHAGGAMVLLVVATGLAVYKPRGVTPYGQRKQHESRAGSLA